MKLSIITINYNNREGLRKTIDSVISQTWQEFEWIIVDGGSTDGSRELIEQTASLLETRGWTATRFSGPEDPACSINNQSLKEHLSLSANLTSSHRILWCSEKDKGIYNAMNKGIVMAQGEYCLFLNSGDLLNNSHSLEDVYKMGLLSDFECFDMIEDRDDKIIYHNKLNSSEIQAHHLIYGSLPHQATFIRRCQFRTTGLYDESLKIVSDWKFELIALIFNSASLTYRPFVFARIQPNGISKTDCRLDKREKNMVLQALLPSLVLKDYIYYRTYITIQESSYICRKMYSILYRLAIFLLKIKNK